MFFCFVYLGKGGKGNSGDRVSSFCLLTGKAKQAKQGNRAQAKTSGPSWEGRVEESAPTCGLDWWFGLRRFRIKSGPNPQATNPNYHGLAEGRTLGHLPHLVSKVLAFKSPNHQSRPPTKGSLSKGYLTQFGAKEKEEKNGKGSRSSAFQDGGPPKPEESDGPCAREEAGYSPEGANERPRRFLDEQKHSETGNLDLR